MAPLRVLVGAVVAMGCAAGPSARPPHAPVELSETLPEGYDSLGEVSAECRARPQGTSFRGEPATSFSCDYAELGRALVEQANARGGTVLAHERCGRRETTGFVCSAEAARPSGRASNAPVGAGGFDGDELLASVAGRIRIDVESGRAAFDRRPRGPDAVNEFATLPIGHVDSGIMRAYCDASECDAADARAGLRLAAGGLGVSDLVSVRCFALDDERSCVATLGMSERDPETDPLAR